eukprot:CAMPEP_0197736640 /NCGR_PEP_ID=MMETSP1435-20131217/2560_1 /TAXON_ID=426625 /ORGANISM="Chaetoceros brevis, Strain CCMP164" /LENGTH=185 /DNA_ID=CAMNT_0043324847 /DNA_START=52 /DNA_END=609 /DNA_ORIENTATION=-
MMLLSSAITVNALAPSSNVRAAVDRRQMFGIIGSAISGAAVLATVPDEANAIALKVGPASPFTGDFEDPNHPGCLRQVKVVGAPLRADGTRPVNPIIEVTGYDGNGSGKVCTEADRPTRSDLWKVQGKMKSNTVASLDFSSKGGPAGVTGTWDDGIIFPDGNKWTKIPTGTPNRRPKDMTTLKSE